MIPACYYLHGSNHRCLLKRLESPRGLPGAGVHDRVSLLLPAAVWELVVMIDEHGYPTEDTLKKIAAFNILTDDPVKFTEYLCENWVNGYPPKWDRKHRTLQLSTGGWSGCESIISALKSSKKFPTYWQMFWYQSRVGGHYWFRNIRRLGR